MLEYFRIRGSTIAIKPGVSQIFCRTRDQPTEQRAVRCSPVTPKAGTTDHETEVFEQAAVLVLEIALDLHQQHRPARSAPRDRRCARECATLAATAPGLRRRDVGRQ